MKAISRFGLGFILAVVLIGLVIGLLIPSLGAARRASPGFGSDPLVQAFARDTLARTEAAPASAADHSAAEGRMVAYTARLTLRVSSPSDEMQVFEAMAHEFGGFVQSSDLQQGEQEGRHIGQLRLRVPAHRLDELLAAIRGRDVQVLSEQRDASDVTEQYIDTDARLRNAQRTEEQLLALMGQLLEATGELDVILATQRELSAVRERIERMQASQRQLQDRVAMARVDLSLLGPRVPAVTGHPQWSAWGTVTAASAALVRTLQAILSVLIYAVITGLPVALLLVLPVAAVVKLISRRPAAPQVRSQDS